jgi:hypothetical protein
MSDTFKYKITQWNADLNLMTVTFEDGGWANITIIKPYPKNLQELDKIVRTFSTPKEVIEAQQADDQTDLMWIANSVGIEREAERFSFYRAMGKHKTENLVPLTSEEMPTDPMADLIARVEAIEAKFKTPVPKKAK